MSTKRYLKTPGFTCYRRDQSVGGKGQGVAILIRSDIPHSPIVLPKTHNLECIGIEILLSGKPLTLISAYQSPNLPFLACDLDAILGISSRLILMGDLNTKHPYWNCDAVNLHGDFLFDHMLNNEYEIIAPASPTLIHYDHKRRPSTPDVVIIKNFYKYTEPQAYSMLSSNHLPAIFSIGGAFQRKSHIKYNYAKADWVKYRAYLDQNILLTSSSFKTIEDIDLGIKLLSDIILEARNLHVPADSGMTPIKLPRRVKNAIKFKNNLRRAALAETDHNRKRLMSKEINNLCSSISAAVKTFNDDNWNRRLAKVDNPSNDLWRVVSSLNYQPHTVPPLKTPSDNITTSIPEQCEALASAFSENMDLTIQWKSEPTINSAVADSMDFLTSQSINDSPNLARPAEIRKLLRKLKPRKAPGHDGINNALLRNISQKAIVLLTKILNACLTLGYFPSSWKLAKVIAIKKPGKDPTMPTSYRPISLLPGFGKLFEEIILTRLSKAVDSQIIPEQFGFRRKHSTAQQLARVSEHISNALNER
ncbi:hypothetical protein O0L34_g4563 [Tuta absoluta]|nr:hypothetical protein O0L34_g4563 [Tuta absoluta]